MAFFTTGGVMRKHAKLSWTAAKSMLLIAIGLALPAAARATPVMLNPTADAFVTTGPGPGFALSGNNYGGAGASGISASGLPNGEFQTVMKLDTSSVKTAFDATYGPGNWTVQSAILTLTIASPNNAIFNANANGMFSVDYMQNNSWVEGTGTPATTPPATAGITFTSLPSFRGSSDQNLGTYLFSGGSAANILGLQSGLTSSILSGGVLSLRLFAADSSVSYLFNSRNFGTTSSRPQLTIDAVPEPTGLAICAIAATVLMGRRQRR